MKKFVIFSLAIFLIFPSVIFAKIGVGVGIGKIEIDEPLKAGGVYNLTPLAVINTGDEPSDYEISIAFHSDQPELRPEKEWFSFDPSPFHMEPGKSQTVAVQLTLPVKTQPGNYFAYLEARPVKKAVTTGGASIGVAAATKLYFTVAPANVFQGIYYRFISIYSKYHPWNTIILVVILAAVVIRLLGKRFKIQIAKK
jgi:hypothetical protein